MELSILITLVLGFATCISPFLVALVNNYHTRALRKIELEANESLRKIELNAELSKEYILSDRDLKYKVIFNFVNIASQYISDYNNSEIYSKLLSAYSECLAIGLKGSSLQDFMEYTRLPNQEVGLDDDSLDQMKWCLESISHDFNKMLKDSLDSALIK